MQKKRDEERELREDELERISSESEDEEELESSDSECSCDWEEYTDDEDVVSLLPHFIDYLYSILPVIDLFKAPKRKVKL